MKIQSKQAIKGLDGKDIKHPDGVFTIGRALSNICLENETGGKMKMFIMAQSFYKGEDIEVDKADLLILKNAVESYTKYNNLVLGQLLIVLNGLKNENKITKNK